MFEDIQDSCESSLNEDEAKRAFDKVMRCVSVSEQSSLKMRKKLENAGFSEPAIEYAIDKARVIHAIDDVRYCEFLFRSTIAQGKGLRKAIDEAQRLGVDYESLECMEDILCSGEEGMVMRAVEVLRKTRFAGKDPKQSALRKLVSKFYPYDVARQATRIYFEELDENILEE